MDDAFLMCGVEPAHDLARVVDRSRGLDRAIAQKVTQRASFEEFGDDERHSAGGDAGAPERAGVEDREDVGMVQQPRRADFLFEPAQTVGIRGEAGRENLDRHVAPNAWIPRAINLPHTAGTEG